MGFGSYDFQYEIIQDLHGGDMLEIVEGHSGKPILLSSYQNSKAELACEIIKTKLIPVGDDIDPGVALSNSLARLAERRHVQLEQGTTFGRSQVVILITFGRINSADKQVFQNALWRMKDRMPESKLIVATRWAPVNDFKKYVSDPNQDILTLQPLNEERRAILDARRIADRLFKIPGHVTFKACAGPDYQEYESFQTLYVLPNTQRVLILHPRQFWLSEDLKMIFEVRYNSANICWSRKNYDAFMEGGNNQIEEQCDSVSVTKGSSASRKATFSWNDPCNGKPPDFCMPIYFRIEAVDSGGLNCRTSDSGNYPCRLANAIEVTIRHQGMTCGSKRWNSSTLLVFILFLYKLI